MPLTGIESVVAGALGHHAIFDYRRVEPIHFNVFTQQNLFSSLVKGNIVLSTSESCCIKFNNQYNLRPSANFDRTCSSQNFVPCSLGESNSSESVMDEIHVQCIENSVARGSTN